MRCTFYVDGDLYEPWEEQLSPGPPAIGKQVTAGGLHWVVKRVTFTQWPDSPDREASVHLMLEFDLLESDLKEQIRSAPADER